MENNLRTAKVERNGYWEDIPPIDIKSGMVFMMFESNGEPVFDDSGYCVFRAVSDAYYNDDAIVVIQREDSK